MKNYIISEQLAQAIGNYLTTRPYGEVVGLIQGLQLLVPVPEVPEEEKTDEHIGHIQEAEK